MGHHSVCSLGSADSRRTACPQGEPREACVYGPRFAPNCFGGAPEAFLFITGRASSTSRRGRRLVRLGSGLSFLFVVHDLFSIPKLHLFLHLALPSTKAHKARLVGFLFGTCRRLPPACALRRRTPQLEVNCWTMHRGCLVCSPPPPPLTLLPALPTSAPAAAARRPRAVPPAPQLEAQSRGTMMHRG